MFRKTTMALAATLVLGTSSLALASGYVDLQADATRNYGPIEAQSAQLTTKHVALPTHQSGVSQGEKSWMDHASQNVDGGGN
jgi:hypothetical protein